VANALPGLAQHLAGFQFNQLAGREQALSILPGQKFEKAIFRRLWGCFG
jgi:hypothetical protein